MTSFMRGLLCSAAVLSAWGLAGLWPDAAAAKEPIKAQTAVYSKAPGAAPAQLVQYRRGPRSYYGRYNTYRPYYGRSRSYYSYRPSYGGDSYSPYSYYPYSYYSYRPYTYAPQYYNSPYYYSSFYPYGGGGYYYGNYGYYRPYWGYQAYYGSPGYGGYYSW